VSARAQIPREVSRVLKPSDWLYVEAPFLQGEHAVLDDFQRWTMAGLLRLLDDWEIKRIEVAAGPFLGSGLST